MTEMQTLLEAAEAVCNLNVLRDMVALAQAKDDLRRGLDRFRCTCGKFPVEMESPWGRWLKCSCGEYWDNWEHLLTWKRKQAETDAAL